MKNLILSHSFIRQNRIPMLLSLFMLSVSCFMLLSVSAQYRYVSYVRSVLERPAFSDTVYAALPTVDPARAETVGDAELIAEQNRRLSEIREMPAVAAVYSYRTYMTDLRIGEYYAQLYAYDAEMLRNFRLNVREGRWLSASAEIPEAVVFGDAEGTVRVGEPLTLADGLTVRVVGRVEQDLIPDLRGIAGRSGEDYFRKSERSGFILSAEALPKPFPLSERLRTMYGFFLKFSEQADSTERRAVLHDLRETGIETVSVDTLAAGCGSALREWMKVSLPLPLFLLSVATVSYLSISVVVVNRSRRDTARLLLIGCTRRHAAAVVTATLVFLFVLPILLNLLLAFGFPAFLREGTIWSLERAILDARSLMPLLLYALVLETVLVLLPLLLYKNRTPLDFYRRTLS
ncbi:MAG TPA: hypothetical protein DDW30_02705 [Clostridiales bacterium]|nr:hypothetical protein [Clostridiales bacterium]